MGTQANFLKRCCGGGEVCSVAEKYEKGERGRKNREFCMNGALCGGLEWRCGLASDTFTNTYVAVYYWVFLSRKSFMSVLKFLSALHPHHCFYVPIVSVSSLFLLCIWMVARVDT
jgi:hypothetical protein